MSVKLKIKKSNITFIIGTFNEEKRIAYPIKQFLPYGDVIVVDNYSTDKTVKIAESLGAKVIKYKNQGWAETKNRMDFVFNHVNTDWICLGAADEMIPKTCLNLYKKISKESKYKVVVQAKKTLLFKAGTDFLFGHICVHFFKKGALNYENKSVHERKFSPDVKPNEVLYLPPMDEYSIYHFSIYTSEKFVSTTNTYSSIQAKFISNKFLSLKILLIPPLSFIMYYVVGRLFMIGMRGFIIAIEFTLYDFLSYAKAYESYNGINYESIENSFQKEKRRLKKYSPQSNIFKKSWAYVQIFFLSRIHKWYKFKKA